MAKFQVGNTAAAGRRSRSIAMTADQAAAMRNYVAPKLPSIIDQVVAKAQKGDLTAARLILDRCWTVPNAMSEELQGQIDAIKRDFEERSIKNVG